MGDSNQLFESLFRPKIGHEDEVDFLRQLTSDHPYFSPAQFFLLQRTSETDADFAKQAAKTAVLFNNPFWLNFQLLEAREKPAEINGIEPLPQPISSSIDDAGIVDQEVSASEPTHAEIPMGGKMIDAEPLPIQLNEHELSIGKNESFGQEEIVEQEQSLEPATAVEPSIEVQADPESPFIEDYPELDTDLPLEAATEMQNTADPVVGIEENGALPDDDEPALDLEEQKELTPLNVRLNIVEPTTTEETISFEPLHTTDYFASQGIRLSNDIKSTDKLGKQLKSFTEWLKTMKKIHSEQPADSVNQTDVTIQKLAEKSNDEDEVVTEAMADVLIQQGKSRKAREVYRKLSLLNPAKTAYFAAKIDQLKEQ